MNKLILLIVFLMLSGIASADSFRCGRKVVKVGDSSNALIKKCGDPVRKYSSKEIVTEDGRSYKASVKNWVYGRKGSHDKIVSIRNGAIVKIRVD